MEKNHLKAQWCGPIAMNIHITWSVHRHINNALYLELNDVYMITLIFTSCEYPVDPYES